MEFENEVKLLRSIRHPHIVLFFGAGQLEEGTPFLVTEYVPRGSLSHLLANSTTPFSWQQKIGWMHDAANGMQFLHSSNPPKIHRDIKPQNFLVTSQLRIKIADFGTAKLFSADYNPSSQEDPAPPALLVRNRTHRLSTGQVGTLPYMAPELQKKGRTTYSKEVDVYSFGLTMWAVAKGTGEDPFNDVPEYEIGPRVAQGKRPTIKPEWPLKWVSLMQRCWDGDPIERPNFNEILLELGTMQLDQEPEEV
jgi:serine/threonine protein kinase